MHTTYLSSIYLLLSYLSYYYILVEEEKEDASSFVYNALLDGVRWQF